jgi:hypothetical protein
MSIDDIKLLIEELVWASKEAQSGLEAVDASSEETHTLFLKEADAFNALVIAIDQYANENYKYGLDFMEGLI